MSKVQKNEMLLLKELNTQKVISIDNAIRILNVSESTVRRLFVSLEQKGLCVRNRRSIRLLSNDFTNIYVYEHVENSNITEKAVIAEKALDLIECGDILFLDAGTTIAKLCAKIAEAIQMKKICDITIFTNSLINLNLLKDYVSVNLIGGEYRENRKDFCGLITEMIIKNVCFNKCFIGTDGYSKGRGFTATDFMTAGVSQSVIANSSLKYILADRNKFNNASGICFASEADITAVITHSAKGLEFMSDAGLTII